MENVNANKRNWTYDEALFIVENHKTLSNEEICKKINRTIAAVEYMKHRLSRDKDLLSKLKAKKENKDFKPNKKKHKELSLKVGDKIDLVSSSDKACEDIFNKRYDAVKGKVIEVYPTFYVVDTENYKTTVFKHASGYKVKA